MNVGVYVRMSTEEQRDFGYSIDGQLREIRSYCERRNLTIVDVYNDAGHSAKDLNRPEMARMINDIKSGKINLVIAMKVDRLTREGYDGQWFLRFCKDNNCGLIFLQENYDVTTPDGEMSYGISLLFGQKERRLISQKTKFAIQEAIRQGKYPGKVPYGYQADENKRLHIEPLTAAVVKEIFELCADGLTDRKIAEIMAKNDRILTRGNSWYPSRITNILTNPIYKGDLLWGRTNSKEPLLFENHSPAIISKELWDKCVVQRDKNKHGNYGSQIHLFHQIVRCPECNSLMNSYYTVKHRNSGIVRNFYVRCLNKNCTKYKISYNSNKIEKELESLLNDLACSTILSKYCLNFPKIDNKKEIDSIKGLISRLDNNQNKLINLMMNTGIDQDIILGKLKSIASEKKINEEKLLKLETGNLFNYDKNIETLFENKKENLKLKSINPIWSMLTKETKREIISRFIEYIDIETDNDYRVKITNITFNSEFLQNQYFNLTSYLVERFTKEYKAIKFRGLFTYNHLKHIIKNDYNIIPYSELVKRYLRKDDNLNTILKKFQDFNLEIAFIIENNEFQDAILMFKKTYVN